jgi:hypothetical protein
MYSESDLQAAVEAGAISAEAAEALRNHVAAQRATPAVDEENFRLITGFNDIFVVIAIALLLTALGWIGSTMAIALGAGIVTAASWGLAEFFTRKRRMALPSIVLLLTFVGGVAGTLTGLLETLGIDQGNQRGLLYLAGVALLTAGAAWLHWRRFRVPITIAAGTTSLLAVLILLFLWATSSVDLLMVAILIGGIGVFAFAMWWDMSDRVRQTRRSDVAFWLHLAAAPMIAHPIFYQLGVFDGTISGGKAVLAVLLYVFLACVSLAIDRRALLVSALSYVLYAIAALFEAFGAISLSVALTALVIGSALLLLSAFWHVARRAIVVRLPEGWQRRLPVVDRPIATARAA